MSIGILILVALYLVLAAVALSRSDRTFDHALRRTVEQLWILVPRMICALIAAGFIAKLIPSALIARYLGGEAGFTAILVAFAAGLIIPAGPAIAFSIAAVFERSGASTPALITFITTWTIFAAHRILIYEVPMLGASFLRMRLLSAGTMPLLAGVLSLGAAYVLGSWGDGP